VTFANNDPNQPGVYVGEPWAIAIDSAGNAWVASLAPGSIAANVFSNGGLITKISPADQILSPSGGYASASFAGSAAPFALAVDNSDKVWVTTGTTVVQLTNSGTLNATFLSAGTAPSGCGEGRTARSLRTVLSAAGMKLHHRYALNIEEEERATR
jgi:hypothetical protein